MLSVKVLVTTAGTVVFTTKGVYELPQRLLQILDLHKKIVAYIKGVYSVKGQMTANTTNPDMVCSEK